MKSLSADFFKSFREFVDGLLEGNYQYPEDVALALDELALAAWREVRELYPPSHMIDAEIVEGDRPSLT